MLLLVENNKLNYDHAHGDDYGPADTALTPQPSNTPTTPASQLLSNPSTTSDTVPQRLSKKSGKSNSMNSAREKKCSKRSHKFDSEESSEDDDDKDEEEDKDEDEQEDGEDDDSQCSRKKRALHMCHLSSDDKDEFRAPPSRSLSNKQASSSLHSTPPPASRPHGLSIPLSPFSPVPPPNICIGPPH